MGGVGGRESTEMFLECRHIKPNGLKCEAMALRGKAYCYFHMRLHERKTRPAPKSDEPLKLPVLEDRTAIQMALAEILDAFASSRLDKGDASLYLYALQIASQNVDRRKDIISMRAVHSMSLTSGGDELGPAVITCPPLIPCSECDIRDTCKERKPDDEDDDDDVF